MLHLKKRGICSVCNKFEIEMQLEVSPMSTFMANKGNITRKWYVIDAAGKPLGKTAAAAADLAR